MTDVQSRPLECLLPMIGVIAGFGMGVFFALALPTEWKTGFEAMWYPRWMGLVLALVFWSMFIIKRDMSLHCGGTQPISSSDKTKYYIEAVCFFILYTGMVVAYRSANGLILSLLIFVFLVAFLSEVGWGNPFHGVNALSRFRP